MKNVLCMAYSRTRKPFGGCANMVAAERGRVRHAACASFLKGKKICKVFCMLIKVL